MLKIYILSIFNFLRSKKEAKMGIQNKFEQKKTDTWKEVKFQKLIPEIHHSGVIKPN